MTNESASIDFDLRQLEVFRKVVDLKSFSKAAGAVFLAQASVSERISTLENMVGTRLLDRLGREVVPTKAGELLYKHAVLLLEMKRTAALEMADFLGIRRGEIRLGGSTIPGEYVLPKVIGRFCRGYPYLWVTLTVGDTVAIENRVLAGDLELGVVGSKGSQKNLIQHELWRDELVLTVPAGHRWAQEREVPVDALCEEPFIFREPGSGTFKILDGYLQSTGSAGLSALRPVACFGTSTAIKEGIKGGLGVSVLSSRAVDTELQAGILKALRITGLPMYRNFFLIRDKRRIVSPLCQALIDFLLATSRKEENGHAI
ncbi:MAG: LysR family transcriptional regulator [Thermodesulfobacteriota bacterium]|nr:LysR family transcriptional regulator [Thermodesulfobacteriota bacterium]